MIMIYHSTAFSLTMHYGLNKNSIPVEREVMLAGLDDGSMYEHVGDVESDDLNTAYRLTNHIDCNWTENEGVNAESSEVRSSSIGDLFITPDGIYAVARCGFDKIRDFEVLSIKGQA